MNIGEILDINIFEKNEKTEGVILFIRTYEKIDTEKITKIKIGGILRENKNIKICSSIGDFKLENYKALDTKNFSKIFGKYSLLEIPYTMPNGKDHKEYGLFKIPSKQIH